MRYLVVLLGLLALGSAPTRSPSITVTPVFWVAQEAPGFVVECGNTAGRWLTIVNHLREGPAFLLDGTPYGELDPMAGIVTSGPTAVPPGDSYTFVVVLGDSTAPLPVGLDVGRPIPFGMSNSTSTWNYPVTLEPGQHALSFRCWGNWSEELHFHWARATKPRAAEQADEAVKTR